MASCHVRSVSLPSPASHHPLAFSIIQQQLEKLKATPQSAGLLQHNIITLKALSQCIDDLLQTQQVAEQNSSPEPATRLAVENLLDASIRLLDMCSSVRDILSRMKQLMRYLESSLRRTRSGSCLSTTGQVVDAYLVCRKRLSHLASKNMKIIMGKSARRRGIISSSSTTMEKRFDAVGDPLVSLLWEVEGICMAELKSLLCFVVSAPRKPHYSSVVSKLMHSKRGEVSAIEVEKIDAEMFAIKVSKFNNAEQIDGSLRGLEGLGSSLEEAEEGLEVLFRRLLRTRVLLLNILSN